MEQETISQLLLSAPQGTVGYWEDSCDHHDAHMSYFHRLLSHMHCDDRLDQ